MRWQQTEYLLKGIFLGLLAYAALQQPSWNQIGTVAAFLGGGLGIAVLLALMMWLPRGIKVGGRFVALILFLVLESPTLVYLGLVGGLLGGALWIKNPNLGNSLLPITVGAGALLGLAMGETRRFGSANVRSMAAAAVAVVLVGVALYFIEQNETYRMEAKSPLRFMLGVHVLLGLPFFYLLSFAGTAEESEGEFAALCGGIAIGVWLLDLTPNLPSLALVIPTALYVLYTRYIMPGLRVFKHTLRGYSYHQMGKIRPALKAFRRALQLEPANQLALTGMTRVHSEVNVQQVAGDPETLALLDLDLCLNRAGRLLWQSNVDPDRRSEIENLLDLVASQKPERMPEIEYWRAVADMRGKRAESAAGHLARLFDSEAWSAIDLPSRWAILFPAWQMALLRSSELAARVGKPQLALPARRMEAIAATERALVENAKDADAWELKRHLYDGLTNEEFASRLPGDGEFDGVFARELGLALLGDPARWRRGIDFLAMAAQSLPLSAPGIYVQMAQAFERAHQPENARKCYQAIKDGGLAIGPKNFAADEQAVFFGVIKKLADEASARGDYRDAIQLLKIFAEYERSGLETLRQLAEMHEKIGDVLGALHYTDLGMVYNSKDQDLLARKDKYYFSVTPDMLRQSPDSVRERMDVAYCIKKAAQILANKSSDLDSVDWALHLADLARFLRPKLIEPRVLWARAMLWKGERDQALTVLEDIREAKPEKFDGSSEEDAWYRTHQILGDLYLNEYNRADLAVPCFVEFRKSSKSGADTLFKLGQAHEAIGDVPRAVKYYEQVTGYPEHPKHYDAQDALNRLRQG